MIIYGKNEKVICTTTETKTQYLFDFLLPHNLFIVTMKGIQRDLLVSNTALLLCCWSFVVSSPYQDHCITIGYFLYFYLFVCLNSNVMMMNEGMYMIRLYLLIACIVTLIDGFGYYRDSLPNGRY